MPEVSVIIPTFNRADYLMATARSVQDQALTDWECLIIDDGSTDNSKSVIDQLIKEDNRFRFYSRLDTDKIKGVSSCRNIGIENAKGRYIVFLDSDDLLQEQCLSNRLSFAQKFPDSKWYLFKMQVLKNGEPGRIIGEVPDNISTASFIKRILSGIQPITVTSVLWERDVLIQLNGFDENLQRLEDPDLHLRAFYSGFEYKCDSVSSPDCYYRMDETYQEKFKDSSLLTKICDSFLYFTDKHMLLLRKNTILDSDQKTKALKKWGLYFFREYFLKLNKFSMYSKFFKMERKAGFLSGKERWQGKLMALYNLSGASNIKGLGYYRLQKKLFN